jgi:SAM-dependent methyltransferase
MSGIGLPAVAVRREEQNRTGGVGRQAVGLTEILQCPQTGNGLHFDEPASMLRVEHSGVTYPLTEGIIDFCPQAHDRVSASYDRAAPRYDSYMTASTFPMRVLGRIIWGFPSDRDPVGQVLALLPDRFDGVLLDVPVGTGVFTASLYRRYPSATILGVDVSMNMLRRARTRFQEQGVNHIHLLKADAAHLPIQDGAVDLVVSLNGWHAFGDKQRATAEIRRVLRPGGRLIACGYIQGARRLSDWFVRRFGVRNGFFTPPFFTGADMARQFAGFTVMRQGSDRSIAWFEAVKEEA